VVWRECKMQTSIFDLPEQAPKKNLRILLGGSPCTHWSIAQKKNRETEARGIGWELFRNYLIAKEKFKPDYFLYENNKSAAQPIKDQISKELGVDLQYINSALVSAQNRQRFYAHNIPGVPQPQDRGILLRDILDSGVPWNDKAYALTTRCQGAIPEDTLEKKRHTMVAEPVRIPEYGNSNKSRPIGMIENPSVCRNGKTYPVYTVKDGLITIKDKTYPIKLPDGLYIIRKLTVAECRRLQTIPEWYKMPCSNSQNYKMLGNGWTVEVIKHILSYIPGISACTVEVLSMYDGMSCGQITLTELGCKIDRYVSYEINKYAIQTTQANFPKTEQRGDAFQLRQENWKY